MQPGTKDLRVTSCQALDACQALLLHLPEKQGQACHRGEEGGVLFLCRQPPAGCDCMASEGGFVSRVTTPRLGVLVGQYKLV